MEIVNRVNTFMKVQPARMGVNREIRKMAKAVARAAPKPDDNQFVISFNASTRITG